MATCHCGNRELPEDDFVPQPIPDVEVQDDDDQEHEVTADA